MFYRLLMLRVVSALSPRITPIRLPPQLQRAWERMYDLAMGATLETRLVELNKLQDAEVKAGRVFHSHRRLQEELGQLRGLVLAHQGEVEGRLESILGAKAETEKRKKDAMDIRSQQRGEERERAKAEERACDDRLDQLEVDEEQARLDLSRAALLAQRLEAMVHSLQPQVHATQLQFGTRTQEVIEKRQSVAEEERARNFVLTRLTLCGHVILLLGYGLYVLFVPPRIEQVNTALELVDAEISSLSSLALSISTRNTHIATPITPDTRQHQLITAATQTGDDYSMISIDSELPHHGEWDWLRGRWEYMVPDVRWRSAYEAWGIGIVVGFGVTLASFALGPR